jgi:hypothetical protein
MKPGNDLGRAGLRLSTLCDLLASNLASVPFPSRTSGRRDDGPAAGHGPVTWP